MTYIEADHVAELIRQHGLVVAPAQWSQDFGAHLKGLAWKGFSLDWNGVEHQLVDLEDPGSDPVPELMASRWPDVRRLFVLYSPSEPGLVADAAFVANEFDQLYWKAPGSRYMCAVRSVAGEDEPDFTRLIEFNGANRLVFAG
ncbi:hypothetical protein ACSHWB_05300 [Lentzea sp. HUAS TT2]|uniref:hypothetical protein n=1 Tax=Lentzea sp. HUAS TT2 TaxID=3447454 RepID=UPI003F6F361E